MPDVDELFPEQPKSVDDLFPPEMEKDRYRRQTLGTSPVQDLIFGDTAVNPIARVLDAFGQGAKQGWGSEPAGLSQESTDFLKKAGIFNDYDQGQKSIIKAANESLFRGAAMYVVDPVMRGLPAAFAGTQAAVAQVGVEAGQEKLGREAAGAFEAFPTGVHAPTGIPHAPPHPMLAEIERAKSLGVIGAGEDGYFGIGPTAVAPPISGAQVFDSGMHQPVEVPTAVPVTPKVEGRSAGMPVDLFIEPRDTSVGATPAPKAEAPGAQVTPEPGLPAGDATTAPSPITADVASKLIAAGRPEAEARASGELIASHYEARAERFKGERGTAEQLYTTEGPDIRSSEAAPPAKSEIKPPEGDTGAAEPIPPETPPLSGGAAEPISSVPELKKALRGRAAADPQTWSLYEFLAKEGGLKSTPDLQSILGGKNPFVPGFGPLLRPTGLTMEEALTRAKENSYVLDPNDLAHAPARADVQPGELTKSVNDLHDMIAEENRDRKNYRNDHVQPEAKINPEEERTSILDALHQEVEAAGGKVDPALEDRVVEIVQKEGVSDVHDAYERAILEDHDKHEGLLNDRRTIKETADIRGHDAADSGAASHSLQEFVDDSGYTWASEQEARGSNVGEPSDHGANDRQAERELAQKVETPVSDREAPVTETPQFKNWFADSKVVDDKGNPVRVFHGTARGGFDMFDTYASEHGLMGQGSYFTEDPAIASEYTTKGAKKIERAGKEPAPSVYPVYLKIERPLDMDVKPDLAAWEKAFKDYFSPEDAAKAKTNEEVLRHVEDMITDEQIPRYEGAEIIQDGFRAMGYDGVTHIGGGRVNAEGPKHRVWIAFDPEQVKSATGNSGAFDPNSAKIFDQIKRGKINLRKDAKPIITLFKDANASTFIHETGHQWLEELMKDSEHPLAPADLKADAIKVLDWLGVKNADAIKTSHHEKFARGFERYMMEGKAPNQALANVFARFKDWLTKIYQTVTRLKSPINDEIRGVFDRLLTMHPSEVKIEPESPAKTFADIHEADAESTPPEMAHPAAETIQAERDSVAARHIPEDQNARLKNTPDQARRSEAGNQQPASDATAAGPSTGEAGNAEASGAIGAGGTEAAPESTPAPKVARTEPPVSANDKFPDKAGNIRLDNLNTPEDLNQIIRQTAEENGDFQNVRGPVSDAQVLDLAEAAGVDAAFIDSRKLGEAWTAPQIVALRRLLIQSAQSVHDLAMKAAGGAEADVMAYAQAKARHQLIQERVSSVTAEAGRALRAFQSRFTEGMAGAQQVGDFLKGATGKTLFQLQQEAKFLSKLQTPQQTSKFITDTSKGTFRNAILEYYINALISGPVTHTRYIVSNAVNAIFTPLIEIPLASAVGKVREIVKGEAVDRVHLGEAGAQLYGLVKGSRDGLSAAIEAFQSGVSPALPNEKVSAHFAEASKAIPGRVGQVLRIPSRSVAGIHSFFKALRYEQNVQGLAYRTAANEGLKGDVFTNRVAELTVSPTEAMMTEATNNALKELYMSPTEYHSKMGGLVRFTNQNLAAKIVVPFMKIGSQITRNAFIERTPLGLLDRKVRSSLSGELGGGELDLQAGKITAGMALMATSVGLMAEGMMTGDGPEDPAKRAVWLLTHTPASIQIGDVTFKYGNTGPLGMLMRFAANTYETAEHMGDHDMATLAVSFFEGFAKSVLDETFLRGVKDMLDAMFHPKEYGGQYLKSQITNWIPWSVGLSQVARKVDPLQRETHGIFQAAQAKIPYLSEQLMPRRDMFGEPIPNGGPLPDYANDPVIKAMDDLHLGVGKIGKKIRGVDLTEQQYDDLARIAGRMAKTRLNAMVNIISNPQVPAAQRIEMIHSTISNSREAARSLVMMQSVNTDNDIIKKAREAKTAQLHGTETAH